MCLCVQVCVHMTFLSLYVCVCVHGLNLCYLLRVQTQEAGALSFSSTVIGAICFACVNIVSGMLRSIIHDLLSYCGQE